MDDLEREMWELRYEHDRLLYTPQPDLTRDQRIVLLGTIRALASRIKAYQRQLRKEKKK